MRYPRQTVLWLEKTGRIAWGALLAIQRGSMVIFGLYLSGLIVGSVILRYFLKKPLMSVEELSLYFVFWYYFLGAALTTYGRSHIKGGGLTAVLKKYPRFLGCLQAAIISISLGLTCLAATWSYQMFSWTLRVRPTTPLLLWPQSYSQLALLVAFPLMSLYFLKELIDCVRGIIRNWRVGKTATYGVKS